MSDMLEFNLSRLDRRRLVRGMLGRRYVVGPVYGADGTTPATGRQAKTGDAVVSQGHGKYYEPASRGLVFAACDQGSGVAVGTTISTTALLSLYNPAGSGKRLAVIRRAAVYFSGTLGTGVLYDCVNNNAQQAAPSSGTLLTSQCLGVGNISGVSAVGVVRVGSTVVAGTAVWPFMYLPPELASTVTAPQQNYEDLEGAIVIEPGCSYQLQAVAAAGTSPKLSPGIWWEEIPIAGSQG